MVNFVHQFILEQVITKRACILRLKIQFQFYEPSYANVPRDIAAFTEHSFVISLLDEAPTNAEVAKNLPFTEYNLRDREGTNDYGNTCLRSTLWVGDARGGLAEFKKW